MAQDKKLQKLELTWIGKDDSREPIEPRILIENPDYSYGTVETGTLPNGKSWNGNMLIHGDNLLALKALEQNYTGAVKCIYIDPPFNTGARINADGQEIGYDDGIEHSIWLNMMYERFAILYNLLRDDGAIFVHLDDNEADYCKVILDEIFHRENFMNRITIDARSPSAFSTVNPGMFVASEYILDLIFVTKEGRKIIAGFTITNECTYRTVFTCTLFLKIFQIGVESFDEQLVAVTETQPRIFDLFGRDI